MPPGLMYDTKEGGEVGGGGASFSPASLSTQSLRRGLDKCQCINYRSSAYRMCFVDQKNEKEEAGDGANFSLLIPPDQQRTLNKLPTQIRCRNSATEHRLGHTNQSQTCRNVCAMCTSSNRVSIFACRSWWLGLLFCVCVFRSILLVSGSQQWRKNFWVGFLDETSFFRYGGRAISEINV